MIKIILRNYLYRIYGFCFLLIIFSQAVHADVENPVIDDIANLMGRGINLLIFGAGIVFAGYIAYGAWKASMSMGDPRGLEGAKQAWTNAIVGLFIIVGSLTIFGIILGLFGVSVTDIPANIVDGLDSLRRSILPE